MNVYADARTRTAEQLHAALQRTDCRWLKELINHKILENHHGGNHHENRKTRIHQSS